MVMRAEMADGRVLEFPDGTDPAVIEKTVKSLIAEQLPETIEQEPSPGQGERIPGAGVYFGNTGVGGLIDTITGAGEINEVAQTLLSSAAAVPASGLAGIASISPIADSLNMGIGPEARKNLVEGVQEGMTIPAESPGAVAKLQTLQDLLDTGIAAVRVPLSKMGETFELMSGRTPEEAEAVATSINENGFSQTYADSILEKTGDPLLASIAYAVPQIIPELIGTRLLNRAPTDLDIRVADKIKQQSQPPGQSADVVEPIPPVEGVGRKILDGAENLVDNKAFDAAVKQGWDPARLAMIKGSSKAEKAKYLNMMQIIKNNKADPTTAIREIHSNVLGASVLERYNHVKAVNAHEVARLDGVAKNLEGQTVDVSAPMAEFAGMMDELSVDISRNNKGKLIVDFKNSDLTPSSHGPIKQVLGKLDRLTREGRLRSGGMDAFAAHELKKFIDEHVAFGKDSPGGIAGRAEGTLKKFRHDIDTTLDTKFDSYNEVNTIIHDTINAMDAFQKQAGKSLDLSAPSAKKTIGILMRRPTSNAKSGGPVMDAVDLLEATARKYQGVFDDNIDSQMLMVQEFERMFPRVGSTSLKGEIVKGSIEALRQSDAERVVNIAGSAIEKARGINEANAIKTIEQLLKEQ